MKILNGDAREVLRGMRANTFHGCLTDPPYGLAEKRSARRCSGKEMNRTGRGFMGLEWDADVPGADVWAEVLRVLKPGAFLLAFGGTRTYHRLASAIEDAGFEIRDCLMWLYGSGFPKAKSCLKPAWEPIILARKRGPMIPLAIDACRIPTKHAGDPGRWPANVILDEAAARALDAQSGTLKSGANPTRRHGPKTRNTFGVFDGGECIAHRGENAGGASRFFYCAKASRSERGEGNTHPTVKPLKLTEHLARLILPPTRNARLIVPFSGAGSEIIGAKRAGWKHVVGIELNREYVDMAFARAA